jgi:hypothetical protein
VSVGIAFCSPARFLSDCWAAWRRPRRGSAVGADLMALDATNISVGSRQQIAIRSLWQVSKNRAESSQVGSHAQYAAQSER